MNIRQRQILVLLTALISLVVLAAPARGADWFAFQVGSHGFGVTFGSTDWWAYGSSWTHPPHRLSYEAVLDGYGEWLWVDGLGRVWHPWVAAGWTPYHHGRWVVTSAGWTWVAYEPWGYFPHHYGQWAYTSYGWVWMPGYDYRPANVVWVRWGGYVGWYPCAPNGWSHAARGFQHGYHSGYHDGYHDGYHAGHEDGWRDAYWATYVPWNHLSSQDISRHAMSSAAVRRTAASSELRVSPDAPDRAEAQRRGVQLAPIARLETRTVALAGRSVTVARPEGIAGSIQEHARGAVERALAPEVARRVADREGTRTNITVGPQIPRAPSTADQGNRADSIDRSTRAPIRSDHDTVVTQPSSSSRARDVSGTKTAHTADRATVEPLRRGSVPVVNSSDSVPRTRAAGLERSAPPVRVERPRADLTATPEARASAAKSPVPAAASRVRRSDSEDGDDAKRDAQPEGRRYVSERRARGTDEPKRR